MKATRLNLRHIIPYMSFMDFATDKGFYQIIDGQLTQNMSCEFSADQIKSLYESYLNSAPDFLGFKTIGDGIIDLRQSKDGKRLVFIKSKQEVVYRSIRFIMDCRSNCIKINSRWFPIINIDN